MALYSRVYKKHNLDSIIFFFKRTSSCVGVGVSTWKEFKKEVISIKIHSIKILRELKQCFNVKQLHYSLSEKHTYMANRCDIILNLKSHCGNIIQIT